MMKLNKTLLLSLLAAHAHASHKVIKSAVEADITRSRLAKASTMSVVKMPEAVASLFNQSAGDAAAVSTQVMTAHAHHHPQPSRQLNSANLAPAAWVKHDKLRSCGTNTSCAAWADDARDAFDLAARCRKCPLRVRLECATQCARAAAVAFRDSRPVTFTHIPKAAGVSFQHDLRPQKQEQNCYLAMKTDGMLSAVMLRTPPSHVRSQFGECYYDSWGRRITHHTNFKRTEDAEADFNAWVRHFETQPRYPAEDFRCIDPREVQARHLSCGYAPNPEANHALSEPPDLGVARYLLRDADFVGVADFYDASVCLLTLRRTGALPPDCACSDAPLRRGAKNRTVHANLTHAHVAHGVPRGWSDGAIADPGVHRLVLQYTALDAQLFASALQRFRADVSFAERVAGRRFLCTDEVEKADALAQTYYR